MPIACSSASELASSTVLISSSAFAWRNSPTFSTISLFRNMPDAAWTRSGIASDNHFSVRALAYIIPGHLTHHLAILRERY